jgi:hypothetical protein
MDRHLLIHNWIAKDVHFSLKYERCLAGGPKRLLVLPKDLPEALLAI